MANTSDTAPIVDELKKIVQELQQIKNALHTIARKAK